MRVTTSRGVDRVANNMACSKLLEEHVVTLLQPQARHQALP